jgi:hypothetical protein
MSTAGSIPADTDNFSATSVDQNLVLQVQPNHKLWSGKRMITKNSWGIDTKSCAPNTKNFTPLDTVYRSRKTNA